MQVIIMNKIIYYIEKDDDEIFKAEMLEDLIEIVKNHIQTIKTENSGADLLPGIEKYFESTLKIIEDRKKLGIKKIYQEISI